jgi:DmsE family decaheme c-type cytochrome
VLKEQKAVDFMRINWPRRELRTGEVRSGAWALRSYFLLVLGTGLLCATALSGQVAQPAVKAASAPAAFTAQVKDVAPGDFVGGEVCASCHAEAAKGFADNPHSKLALEHGGAGVTCESCHGAGKAHVDGGGDITKIFNPAKATPGQVDAMCLSCHAASHPNFLRSPHAKANVSCVSCHSVHSSVEKEQLLKAAQPTLCFQCHTDVKPSFDMPFHHKVNEGLVTCSDCHDVHGTFGNNNLRSTADQNQICTKCHTETRGPFVFEHAAVKAEGCLGCHTPHGSQNARLLNMPNVNTLCNQCHSPVAAGTVHSMGAGSSELTPCTSCHTYIHGSNVNPAFLR